MAIKTGRAQVTTVRSLIYKSVSNQTQITVRKESDSNPIYIGPNTVSVGDGFVLHNTQPIPFSMRNGDELHAIAVNGVEDLTYIVTD